MSTSDGHVFHDGDQIQEKLRKDFVARFDSDELHASIKVVRGRDICVVPSRPCPHDRTLPPAS